MKKGLTLVFSVFALLLMSLGFVACGSQHQHSASVWTEEVAPTCTVDGYRTGVCDTCGKTFTVKLAKLGHTPEVTQEHVEPTCTTVGHTEEIKCLTCHITLQEPEEIAAKGHDYDEWQEITQPTCQKEGYKQRACKVCSHPEIETIAKLEHEYGAWDAHSGTIGQHKRSCQNCHEEEIVEYTYIDEKTDLPDCSHEGRRYGICFVCGEEVTHETFDKLAHNYVYEEVIVADETSQNHTHKHHQKCTNCGHTTEDEECSLQEGEVIDATCTKAKYQELTCDKCGSVHEKILAKANGHTWTYENVAFYEPGRPSTISRHNKICSVCAETVEERCPIEYNYYVAKCEKDAYHEYSCPTCKAKRIITVAGSALKHNYGAWEFDNTTSAQNAQHKRTCQREGCGHTETQACDMVETTTLPTCTTPGEVKRACKVCFNSFTEQGAQSVGHKWGNWLQYEIDPTMHYHECSVCHDKETEKHQISTTHEKAECEKNAVTIETCDRCQLVKRTEEQGTALKHVWVVSKITDEKHAGVCSLCEKQADGEHDFSESNLCSVCQYDGLNYEISGNHAIVSKSDRVLKAGAKYIVINAKHKVLDEEGNYRDTEFDVTIAQSFMGFSSMETLILPGTLTTIKTHAFSDCRHLKNVEIDGDSALVTIEDYAFYYCPELVSFEAPQSLRFIGEYAFANCTALNEISICDLVEDIKPRAFYNTGFTNESSHWSGDVLYLGKHLIKARQVLGADGTYSNTAIKVKENTLTIAANAFSECQELVSIQLPKSLTHIDADAFLHCTKLASVNFTGDIYQWLAITFVNDYSSPLCYGETGLQIDNAEGEIDLTDPEKVKHVITHIPSGTFRGTGITSIILPKTLVYIGREAFENCASLTSITFEDGICNVSYVGKDVLLGCTAYLNNETNWDDCQQTNKGKVLYLGGKILVEAEKTLSGAYSVKQGTTVIVEGAFEGCENLESVTLNEELMYVGLNAFEGCTKLNTVTFTDTSALWLCTHRKFNIARGFTGNELSWNTLSAYSVWKKVK